MNEVSLRRRQGELRIEAHFSLNHPWTVLFGPSGAGKSSILRMLAGLSAPDEGHIVLGGNTLLDTTRGFSIPPGRRAIGFVTQQAALFPHLRVSENVAFGIRHLPRKARATRIDEMLRLFGAEHLAQRRTPELSGGERQRVALARALAPSPRLLLLDEPLSALDGSSAQDILSRLMALDLRVLYVSHDLPEIWRIPAQVVLLHHGQVAATGPLQQVLANSRDRLLQQLGV
jgi:ABC-type molybdate transport system ATPase subunit